MTPCLKKDKKIRRITTKIWNWNLNMDAWKRRNKHLQNTNFLRLFVFQGLPFVQLHFSVTMRAGFTDFWFVYPEIGEIQFENWEAYFSNVWGNTRHHNEHFNYTPEMKLGKWTWCSRKISPWKRPFSGSTLHVGGVFTSNNLCIESFLIFFCWLVVFESPSVMTRKRLQGQSSFISGKGSNTLGFQPPLK